MAISNLPDTDYFALAVPVRTGHFVKLENM